MTTQLQGKVALITGSDSGIGQGTAAEFAKEGADVVVHYLGDEAGANNTRQQIEAVGRRGIGVQADLRDEAAAERLFDKALEAFGTVDILMNDAGAAEPWEIGRLAVFLASSDAHYATGPTYVIDGGLMQNQGQGA